MSGLKSAAAPDNQHTEVLRAASILGALSLLCSAILAVRYSGQHILGFHAFRQTQTALTTFWICRDGFRLAYETPATGAPWSIPFEFPFYQLLVASLSYVFGANIERTGRLISFAFLLACLWPVKFILRRLFPSNWRLQFAIFIPLFLMSPLYLFWGRSFMIETAALFLSLTAAQLALPLVDGTGAWKDSLATFALFTLAFLQKSTTAAPVWFVVLVAATFHLLASGPWRASLRRVLSPKYLLAFAAPFLIGASWTRFTDVVKMQNLAGQHLTSAGSAAFTFGTLGERFNFEFWYHVFAHRLVFRNTGGPLGAAVILFAILRCDRKTRLFLCAALLAFLIPILLFTNLHLVHDYYQTANLVFLLLALAVAFAFLLENFPRWRRWWTVCFVLVLICNVGAYLYTGYAGEERLRFTKENNRILALAEYLKSNTRPDQPIISFGLDWSSELPFFSERRALGVPNWFTRSQQQDIIRSPSAYVASAPSAIIFCGEGFDELKNLAAVNAYRVRVSLFACDVTLPDPVPSGDAGFLPANRLF